MSSKLIFLLTLAVLCGVAFALTPQRGKSLVAAGQGGVTAFEATRAFSLRSDKIQDSIRRIKVDKNTHKIYAVSRNSFIQIDGSTPLAFANSTANILLDPDQANDFVDYYIWPYGTEGPELHIVGTAPSVQITKFKFNGNNPPSFINQVGVNPKKINGGLESIYRVIFDETRNVSYAITKQTRIVKLFPDDFIRQQENYFEMDLGQGSNPYITREVSHDVANSILWFAGLDGAIYRVQLDNNNASDSTVTKYDIKPYLQLNANALPAASTFAYIYYEAPKHRLHAATTGTKNDTARIITLDVGVSGTALDGVNGIPNSIVKLVNFTRFDFDVVTGAVDPLGMLYLATEQVPSSIIQFDLANLNYEVTVQLPSGNLAIDDLGIYSPKEGEFSGNLYVSVFDVSDNTLLQRWHAAGACEQNCWNHGTCSDRQCTCETFMSKNGQTLSYVQPWCQQKDCETGNSGKCNGIGNYTVGSAAGPHALGCSDGVCLCNPRWTGDVCQTEQCPNACTNTTRGACNITDFTCKCTEGFTGEDCGISLPFQQCYLLRTCGQCLTNPTCGWCESEQYCQSGNPVGPANGEKGCRAWHFNECPGSPSGINVGSIIIAIIVGLLFAWNIISLILEDTTDEKEIEKRDEWYRFQRSSKMYLAWHQLQFFAVVTILGLTLSTNFLSFTRIWLPLMGFHGYPQTSWGPRGDQTVPVGTLPVGRMLLSLDQAEVYAQTNPGQVIFQVLATWVVFTFGFIVMYCIIFPIVAVIRGQSERIGTMITSRPLYIFFRGTQMFYFPIAVFSAAEIVRPNAPSGALITGIVFFVVIGVIYPIALTFLLKTRRAADLFTAGYKYRFYPIYGTMDHKKVEKFATIIPYAKWLLLAIWWGFLASSPAAQLALSLVTFVAYVVVLIIVKPYSDYLQLIADCATAGFSALSILPLFAFVAIPTLDSQGILGVTIVFLLFNVFAVFTAVGFYFYSWAQMRKIFSLAQLCGRDK